MHHRRHNLAGVMTTLESGSIEVGALRPPHLVGIDSSEHPYATVEVQHEHKETGAPSVAVAGDRLTLYANTERYNGGSTLYYVAELAAERARQEHGGAIVHGASVYLPESDRGILILGEKGAGKTTTAANLCVRHSAELIANDQVVLGRNDSDELKLVDGTKSIRIRRSAALQDSVLAKLADFPADGSGHWDDKRSVEADGVTVPVAEGSRPLTDVVQVVIDRTMERTEVKHGVADLQTVLFLSELTSRHIRGVTTPIIANDGTFEGMGPSVDTAKAAEERAKLVTDLLHEFGIIKVYAPSVDHVIDEVLQRG